MWGKCPAIAPTPKGGGGGTTLENHFVGDLHSHCGQAAMMRASGYDAGQWCSVSSAKHGAIVGGKSK